MYSLHPATWKWDFARLPREAQLAFIGRHKTCNLIRLTESLWAFRAESGAGPHLIATLEELLPYINQIPPAEPYTPRVPASRPPPIELDLSDLDLGEIEI